MPKVTIWSSFDNEDVEVEFSDEQHADMVECVQQHLAARDSFVGNDILGLFPKEEDEDEGDIDFDIASIVTAFLPPGYGVLVDGYEDHRIVRVDENGEEIED